jgi:membrane-bound serine protease (ClpP class)
MPFDPNLAYFLLVFGLWVAATAAYIPGTGLIEVVAGIMLVVALGLLSALPTDLVGLLLLAIGVVGFAVIPFINRRPIGLVVVGIALQVIGSVTLFNDDILVSPVLMLVSLGLPMAYHTMLLMPMMERQFASPSTPTMERDAGLVGMTGRVVQALEPVGAVHVDGETWTAEGRRKLPVGAPIIVIKREGLRLIVDLDKQKRDQLAAMEGIELDDEDESAADQRNPTNYAILAAIRAAQH